MNLSLIISSLFPFRFKRRWIYYVVSKEYLPKKLNSMTYDEVISIYYKYSKLEGSGTELTADKLIDLSKKLDRNPKPYTFEYYGIKFTISKISISKDGFGVFLYTPYINPISVLILHSNLPRIHEYLPYNSIVYFSMYGSYIASIIEQVLGLKCKFIYIPTTNNLYYEIIFSKKLAKLVRDKVNERLIKSIK